MASVATLLFPAVTFATRAQASTPVQPVNGSGIAPWKLANSWVQYWGGEVRVTINGATRTVTTDNSARLDWTFAVDAVVSPDGRYVAYVSADDRGYTNATITVVNLNTGTKSVVARPGSSIWPVLRWSPDSRQLAYVTQQSGTGNPQVYIVDTAGTYQRLALVGGTFTRASLLGYISTSYGWSVDGKALVYYEDAHKPTRYWTVSLSSGQRTAASPTLAKGAIPASGGGGGNSPCLVPQFWQSDPAWGSLLMQSAGQSISQYGCTLTSATMVLDYYGATQNPGTMNSCMGPYADSSNGWVWGQAITRGCDQGYSYWSTSTSSYSCGSGGSNDPYTYLNAGHPPILSMTGGYAYSSHFVVITSGNYSCNTAYLWINDPRDGQSKTLDYYYNSGAQFLGLRVYVPRSGYWAPCHY